MSLWNLMVGWFQDRRDRHYFLKDFNESAKRAFISGHTDILLKASISYGNSEYRHAFSKFMAGGFRIKVEGGRNLGREEVLSIGKSLIANSTIVRTMISLGWDTLEIHPSNSSSGLQWRLNEVIYLS